METCRLVPRLLPSKQIDLNNPYEESRPASDVDGAEQETYEQWLLSQNNNANNNAPQNTLWDGSAAPSSSGVVRTGGMSGFVGAPMDTLMNAMNPVNLVPTALQPPSINMGINNALGSAAGAASTLWNVGDSNSWYSSSTTKVGMNRGGGGGDESLYGPLRASSSSSIGAEWEPIAPLTRPLPRLDKTQPQPFTKGSQF